MKTTQVQPVLLRGKIVQHDGTAADRYVLIRDGVIEAVSRRRPPQSDDARLIETAGNDWIFPGLLDLHTHTDKNVMPIWEHGKGFFANRFEWRGDADYKRDINGVFKTAKAEVSRNVIPTFAEVQAVAGGTTTLQESWDLDAAIGDGENALLCRGTGDLADFDLNPKHKIFSVVDFFRPNKSFTKVKLATKYGTDKKVIEEYARMRDKGKLQSTLVHLAEGRSGFGDHVGPVDTYSRLEWEAFKNHPCMEDPEKVRQSSLAIIHGCAINPHDESDISFLRDRNISVIWSPVSNMLLYGDTLEVEPLIHAGVNVALGSDWSPSGSKHVWEEAKLARYLFDAMGSMVSDAQIFQMVTGSAARCLGIHSLGRIAPGCFADFFILRSPLESDNPMEVFFKTTDRDVRAVIIGGLPIYGEKNFLKQFELELQHLPRVEGSAVENKSVHLPDRLGINLEKDVDQLEAAFKKQGVKRSNLLASSDTPYRHRIAKLKKYVTDYAWSIQRERRRRRKGRLQETRIPVPPDAVRVWRGFNKQEGLKREDFTKTLRSLFIPSVAPFQAPLGLTAYVPAIIPAEAPTGTPDEIAIVFYESQQTYFNNFQTLGGRAYGLLHQTVFELEKDAELRSTSTWPILFDGELKSGQPYHLFPQATDWQHGHVHVLVATRKADVAPKKFKHKLGTVFAELQIKTPKGFDAAIVVATEDYVCYWEHWQSGDEGHWESKRRAAGSVVPELLTVSDAWVDCAAKPYMAAGSLFDPNAGLDEDEDSAAFNVQFQRRSDYERLT